MTTRRISFVKKLLTFLSFRFEKDEDAVRASNYNQILRLLSCLVVAFFFCIFVALLNTHGSFAGLTLFAACLIFGGVPVFCVFVFLLLCCVDCFKLRGGEWKCVDVWIYCYLNRLELYWTGSIGL